MAKQVQVRVGTTLEHSSFIGANAEVTVDETKHTVVVHDGSTQGGFPLLKENMSNYTGATIANFKSTGISDNASGTRLVITNNYNNFISPGTMASPSIVINSDTDTGLYSPVANELAFSTAGNKSLHLHSNGSLTTPKQPSFLVYHTSDQTSFNKDEEVLVNFNTPVFDQGNNFSNNTFIAPTSGVFQFNAWLKLTNVDMSATSYQLRIRTTSRTFETYWAPDSNVKTIQLSTLAFMNQGDSAYVTIYQTGGTPTSNIIHSTAGHGESHFSGHLVG